MTSERHNKLYLIVALTVALFFTLWAQTPRLLDAYQVEEDFRNLYWVNLFTDPQAFPEEPHLENNVVQLGLGNWTLDYVSNSSAYGLLFKLASQFTTPVLFSKLLIFPLLLAPVYFVFRIGQKIAGEGTALALSLAFTVLNLASHNAILLPAAIGAALALFLPENSGQPAALGRSPTTRITLAVLSGLLILLVILYRKCQPQHEGQDSVEREATQSLQLQRRNWIVLGAILVLLSSLYIEAVERDYYAPPREERQLYEYLASLPMDAFVAGASCILDGVPYYTHRQVLFSCWRFDRQTAMDSLDAYYAESGEAIGDFCRQYGVDYLVVNEETLDPELIERGEYLYEPYSTTLYPILKWRTDFALSRVPQDAKLFQSHIVMACETVRSYKLRSHRLVSRALLIS